MYTILNVVLRIHTTEVYLNERLTMMMLIKNDSYQMHFRQCLGMYLQMQDDDIELVSIDVVNYHNHQHISEYSRTMNNCIVYHDFLNMLYNQ